MPLFLKWNVLKNVIWIADQKSAEKWPPFMTLGFICQKG